MKLPKDQPFWTSVILHLVVLLGLFLATIVQAFKPKEKPHVFEMVDAPSDVSQSNNATPLPQPPLELPPVELPPVPQVDIPTRPPPPPPKPAATVKPTPTKPERLISAADFFKDHPKENPTPRPPPPRQNITVPQIDVPKLVVPRNPTPGNPSPQLSQQQLSALADYSSRLRSKIDAAWAKPAQLAGVRLVAEVVFDVSASGRITNVRLNPGSGNSAFDQSVLAAFRKVASTGPTPTGQVHTFSLPFRMRD
ncbi:MAG: protein TonB [Candidatus Azotimanducaceae bacterium]|jgi:protein TonB